MSWGLGEILSIIITVITMLAVFYICRGLFKLAIFSPMSTEEFSEEWDKEHNKNEDAQ